MAANRAESLNFQLKHFCVVGILVLVNVLKCLVFGTLSDEELRILSSRTGHTLWELVTGFLVFYLSSEIGQATLHEALKYGGLFFCVLLVKFFGFLIADRVHKLYFSHPAGAAGSTKYGYLRLGFGIAILNMVNLLLLFKFVGDVLLHRYSQHNVLAAIFGFEVLDHCSTTISTSFTFALNCYETLTFQVGEPEVKKQWRRKKLGYIYAIGFLLSLTRFGVTTFFSLYFLYHYTFPFHSMPSSYMTLKVTVAKARALVDWLKRNIILHKLKVPSGPTKGTCIVCYEDLMLALPQELRLIVPCEHSFHDACLRKWLRISPTCPVCRQIV